MMHWPWSSGEEPDREWDRRAHVDRLTKTLDDRWTETDAARVVVHNLLAKMAEQEDG